jgi:hypothetical protein
MAVASDITLPVFGCRRAEVYVSLGGLVMVGLAGGVLMEHAPGLAV